VAPERQHASLSSFWRLTALAQRLVLLVAATLCLCLPAGARAHGDPASDYLLTQDAFLPFGAEVDGGQVNELGALLGDAARQDFRVRVAIILNPSDLGTAFSLFGKPQRYAQFLGLELSFAYRDRLLVVMPNGYGYAVEGNPDPQASSVLKRVPPPGRDATKEVAAAIVAVQRLAAASGKHLTASGGGKTASRDRLTIAAAATAALTLAAAFVLYRRRGRTLSE
jgi:hypothetical protein